MKFHISTISYTYTCNELIQPPKRRAWKQQIALMIWIAWISLDGMAILTRAEVQPSVQREQKMINPYELQEWEDTAVDIGESLVEIAQRATRESTNQMVDLAFVINGSVPMEKSIRAVEKSLADIIYTFEESLINYQIGLVWFQNLGGRSRIAIKPFQSGLAVIENNFFFIMPGSKFKGYADGYGLDAIMKGLRALRFRRDAEKLLVVVTKSELKTRFEKKDETGENGRNQVIERILHRCEYDEIRINVIGISESLQIELARLTGGKWYRISKDPWMVNPGTVVDIDIRDLTVPKIDEMFKWVAQHIAETVKHPIDLVFIYDSSLSMRDKVDASCIGLDKLVQVLDSEGLNYRFGVIRFWAQLGGGRSTVITTKPPLSVDQVKELFRRPNQGDEHLLDAIMEGVPKLRTPDDRKLVLFIVTDEYSSKCSVKKYTHTRAIEVCRDAVQVNVIGVTNPPFYHLRIAPERFQTAVTEVTNGRHYAIPDWIFQKDQSFR